MKPGTVDRACFLVFAAIYIIATIWFVMVPGDEPEHLRRQNEIRR